MKWKPYPSYKDSGVEWLGRIPAQWNLRTLKHTAMFFGGGTPSKDNPAYWAGDIPWVSPKDMKDETVNDSEDHITPDAIRASATRMIPSRSVLLVVRSGILKHTIPVGINSRPVALNQDMKAIVPKVGLASTYLAWFFRGLQSVLLLEWRKAGATVESLEHDFIARTRIPCPDEVEQQAIAGFLDRETGKIDALVKKKERLIELLQEKRNALISHAVTQGLNPNAPKKDSGIPWLGHIPKHWQLKKLGHVANIVRGGSPRPAGDPRFFDGDACPWITVAEITKDNGKFLNETETCLTDEGRCHSRFLNVGTLVMTNSGATLGVPKILNIAGCINDGSVAFLDLKASVVRIYLYYYLASLTENLRDRIKQGSGQPNLNTSIFRSIWFPVGDVDEQEQILGYLDRETASLDALMGKVRMAIERLQEYRTALISAAVTGQIDVRSVSTL